MIALALHHILLASLAVGSVLARPMVMTPRGARSASSVHLVPEGGSVAVTDSGDVHLLDGTGAIIHISSNVSAIAKRASTCAPRGLDIVADATWTNTGTYPIAIFEAVWTVPPVPTAADGQTLFLYDALQTATGASSLQPVLQYGPSAAGGGAYWSVATWYFVGGQTFFTKPIQVAPGRSLGGVVEATSTSSTTGTYNYLAGFSGISATNLPATGSAQLVKAVLALEGYNTAKATDYPTGSTVFRSVTLRTTRSIPAVTYTTGGNKDQGVTSAVNRQGAILGQYTITY